MPISTKGGDGGLTDFRGERFRKDDALIEALGCLDELQAFLAEATRAALVAEIREGLDRLVSDCAQAMSILGDSGNAAAFSQIAVSFLEDEIFWMEEKWMPRGFVLPGRTASSAKLDVCRTVCRRAERQVLRAGPKASIAPVLQVWLNRLSDYLFLAARGEERERP